MRVTDYLEHSLSSLWKKKLRTFLTAFGVVIGIGALVSMYSFGQGVQKNITERFEELDLFKYITVFSGPFSRGPGRDHYDPDHHNDEPDFYHDPNDNSEPVLDDALVARIRALPEVEMVFVEIRFPAMIRINTRQRFSLIQALPADVCRSGFMKLRAGRFYHSGEDDAVIISDRILHRLRITDPRNAVGKTLVIDSLVLDFGLTNPWKLFQILSGNQSPFTTESHTFTIVGVTERVGIGGSMPVRSDAFITPSASQNIKKISFTNVRELFQASRSQTDYSMISVKLKSVNDVPQIQQQLEDWDLNTFALSDQMEEMKKAFLFMDMFLFAISMIAITVAALGITNTMVMSILERYKEIGIMKALGATNQDVTQLFFFECSLIGLLGGVFGLLLGWLVSRIINQVANYFMAQQGVPHTDLFYFPWWLCLGAIGFSLLISLLAGIYPALRAARVDPVVALRHE